MNAMLQPSPDFYVAGGTLDSTASSYIVREADKELLDAVKAGQFCYILTTRQMGKSSLMVRTASSLQESGILSVIIDLSGQDTTSTNTEQWYLAQVLDIAEQLGLHEDYIDWWQRRSQWGVVRCFTQFLTHIVLKKVSQSIVIFIDEIDSTLSLPFNCDDYFAMIRALYNKRAVDSALKRLTFVLLGVASPSDLIKDAHRTPFNIGTRIHLTDFTIQEAQPLISGLARDQKLAEKILENILFFTGGHPYLTQKACLYVAKEAKSQWNGAEASIIVERLIEEMFLSETGQNTDDNLQFIRKRILSSKANENLLQRYRLVRLKRAILDDELDPILMELKLSGLVKSNAGMLVVRNVIYERVFNETWIGRALQENIVIVGRESELKHIDESLKALLDRRLYLHRPIIEVQGVGGIGKTYLLEYVKRRCQDVQLPYIWVDGHQRSPGVELEIIVQVQRYTQPLDNRNPSDATQVVKELLKQGPVVMLLDAVDAAETTQLSLIEKLLKDLIDDEKLFVVLASRKPLTFQQYHSVARKLTIFPLKALERQPCESYLDTFYPPIKSEVRDIIFEWTRGYPIAMKVLTQAVRDGVDPRTPEGQQEALVLLMEQVIDKRVLATVDPIDRRTYFFALQLFSLPRRFNLVIMEDLITRFAPRLRLGSSIAYWGLPKEINEATDVLNWNIMRAGFAVDEPIRTLFLLLLKAKNPERYFAIHEFLAETNRRLAREVHGGFDRARYIRECLYHTACMMDSPSLEQQLLDALQLVEQELPETLLQFSEEFKQDRELKEALGKYFGTVEATISQYLPGNDSKQE